MVPFTEYFRQTIDGVLNNALFVAVIIGMIVTDIRNFLGFNEFINKRKNNFVKIFFVLLSYPLILGLATLALVMVIFVFWVISLWVG